MVIKTTPYCDRIYLIIFINGGYDTFLHLVKDLPGFLPNFGQDHPLSRPPNLLSLHYSNICSGLIILQMTLGHDTFYLPQCEKPEVVYASQFAVLSGVARLAELRCRLRA